MKFYVQKREDIEKVCSMGQLRVLEEISRNIFEMRKREGKTPVHQYYVVNVDEHYADTVKALIEEHENETIKESNHERDDTSLNKRIEFLESLLEVNMSTLNKAMKTNRDLMKELKRVKNNKS